MHPDVPRTKKAQVAKLEQYVAEAALIRGRHDGVHNAHGKFYCLRDWLELAKIKALSGEDWACVECLIRSMRIIDKTGMDQPRERESEALRQLKKDYA